MYYRLPIKIGFKVILEVFLLISAHYNFYAGMGLITKIIGF
ncbi:hypothetical protein RINTHM_9950 [Richelia intracellularis HM01]|nr:hypothetical protein RINTHM_9950 [Richelia intracellularis HM01]